MDIRDRDGDVILTYRHSLNGANLDGRDLSFGVFDSVTMQGVFLLEATLIGASFVDADLYWANLSFADASNANFRRADLRGANLCDTKLASCNFSGAKLGLDEVGGATMITGADLSDAVLVDCVLHNVIYDRRTKFPIGFDPIINGLQLEKE